MHLITGLLVLVGLVGTVAGLATYIPVRPWRAPIGRHLVVYMSAMVGLYALVTANLLLGHYPGREVVTIAVAAVLDAAVWWRWRLVYRARPVEPWWRRLARWRRNRRDRERAR